MKLIPIVSQENAHLFCTTPGGSPFTWNENLDADHAVATGLIRMGKRVSLLSLSDSPQLREVGLQDMTDSLGTEIRLSAVAIGTPDGVVKEVISIPQSPRGRDFTRIPVGRPHKLTLNYVNDDLKSGGVPFDLKIAGEIFLDTGEAELHAGHTHVPNSEYVVIGYTLDAQRINSNRRPASPGAFGG
jgi:hypothetical protein